eukprot:TRINITY_DN37907_c0_g2_i1.p1 TRINITY_DN37907_c0_g2~~TRINITY_DN37907_c0_g2_i1.p1  ORF type:complete len:697 (+),score=84.68 TRINITY_DN37907_c0_g2_i1:88-2091(+)
MGKKKPFCSVKAKQTCSVGNGYNADARDQVASVVPADGCRVQRGLSNLGNSCWMNSIIQCLNVSLPFSDDLLRISGMHGLDGVAGHLCSAMIGVRDLCDASNSSRGAHGSFPPKPFRESVAAKYSWYRAKNQHDAHEFLLTLLGCVADSVTKSERAEDESRTADEDSLRKRASQDAKVCGRCVAECFRGRLCSSTLCWECGQISLRLDPCLSVSLALPALASQQSADLGIQASKLENPVSAEACASPQLPDKADTSHAISTSGKSSAGSYVDASKMPGLPPSEDGSSDSSASDAECEPAAITARADEVDVQIELVRRASAKPESWGIKWSESGLEGKRLLVTGVVEESLLDKWNLKRRAMGDLRSCVHAGLELVSVNTHRKFEEMRHSLKSECSVSLQFLRRQAVTSELLGPGRADSDDEAERSKREAAESRGRLRDAAEKCLKDLPPALRRLFAGGPVEELAGLGRQQGGPKRVPLHACLRQFAMVQALEKDCKPQYTCSSCAKAPSEKSFASRRMWLWPQSLPKILMLHLQRFRRYGARIEKSATSLELSPTLDLAEHVVSKEDLDAMRPYVFKGQDVCTDLPDVTPALLYELYAVCVHQGDSMHGGHYIVYVNAGPSLQQSMWRGADDAKVWSCELPEVLKAEAYIAFYRRPADETAAIVGPLK